MTLAQVQAAVSVILALIGTWTGFIIAVALLLPLQTDKAQGALRKSPRACFGAGIVLLVATIVLFGVLQTPSIVVKLAATLLLLGMGCLLGIGAAGVAGLMSRRIGEMTGGTGTFTSLLQGSVVFSLAMGFPLVGWLLFLPMAIVFSLGAGAAAVLPSRGTVAPPFTTGTPGDFDVA